MKILLVEDDENAILYLEKGLTENGFIVDAAQGGETAPHLARTREYDLVILDVMLPGRDGWSVLRESSRRFASPRVMFMHIGGMGDATKLADAVGKVWAKIKETSGGKGSMPTADIDPANSSLDPAKIDAAIGHKGDFAKGVYKVTIGRTTQMDGHTMGNTMGVNTWATFAGSDDKAVVDGDFAMTESELQGVLKALRASGINIVAIHNHMTGESPRIMFLHFWGIGTTTDLAKGLKAALDTQAK